MAILRHKLMYIIIIKIQFTPHGQHRVLALASIRVVCLQHHDIQNYGTNLFKIDVFEGV
jgi:hypothetical protein